MIHIKVALVVQVSPSADAGQRGYCESATLSQLCPGGRGLLSSGASEVPSRVSPGGGLRPASATVVGKMSTSSTMEEDRRPTDCGSHGAEMTSGTRTPVSLRAAAQHVSRRSQHAVQSARDSPVGELLPLP